MKHLEPNRKVTVMLPTRNRIELLKKSIYSLVDTASSTTQYEILIAVDTDDNETINYLNNYLLPELGSKEVDVTALLYERVGYKNLHLYYNSLAKSSAGEWLLLWNDDAIMVDNNWDLEIAKYDGQFKLLRFKENHNDHPNALFPCVPRDWVMLFDMLSPIVQVDSWVSQVCYLNDIVENINCHVFHDRYDITGNNNDTTAIEKLNQFANAEITESDTNNINDISHPDKISLKIEWAHRVYWYLHKINQGNDWFYKFVKDPNFDAWSKFKEADKNKQCFVN